MAFYPFVSPGDQVNPDSRLENDIRRLVNNFNSIGGAKFSGKSSDKISVPVYNATDSVIQRGASVEPCLLDNNFTWDMHDPIPIRIASATSNFWGVLTQTLAPNDCGDVVFCGFTYTYTALPNGFYSPDGVGGVSKTNSGNGLSLGNVFFVGYGGSGVNTAERGYFSAKLENGILYIYDSAYGWDASSVAGYCDIGNNSVAVNKAFFPVQYASGTYSFGVRVSLDKNTSSIIAELVIQSGVKFNNCRVIRLGRIVNNKVVYDAPVTPVVWAR